MVQIPITERKYGLIEKIDETPEVLVIKFMPDDNSPVAFDPGMLDLYKLNISYQRLIKGLTGIRNARYKHHRVQ